MRVVFAGTPEVAVPALDALHASAHELVGVVTRPDAPSGRGRKLVASPVALRAEELGLPVLKPEHPRDPDFQAALRDLAPDACPVVAYGALLPQSALDIPEHGWINLHFSILPAWRGAAPVQHSIWAGDEMTGATTFRIVKELDAGPTYGVMTERIRPTDTAGDLLGRLAEGGATLLVAHPRRHRGRRPSRPASSPPTASAWRPRSSSTTPGSSGPTRPSAVDRQVRACTPGPGRLDDLGGRAVQGRAGHRRDPTTPRLAPGRPRGHQERRPRRHRARDPVGLGEVKAFGKKEMRGGRLGARRRRARGRPPRLTHAHRGRVRHVSTNGSSSLRGAHRLGGPLWLSWKCSIVEHTVAPHTYNRWLIPPAALAVHLCIGQAYATSVYKNSLVEHFDASQTAIGFVFSIAIVMLGLSAPRSSAPGSTRSARARRCSPPPAAGPPGFLVGAAGIATGQLWLLYLGYGVIGGIGLGIGYISPVSTLIKWFPDRPGPGHRHGDHGLRRRRDGRRARLAPAAGLLRPGVRPHRRRLARRRRRADRPVRHPRHRLLRDHDARRRQHPRARRRAGSPRASTPPQVKQKTLVTEHDVSAANAIRTPQFWLLWTVLFCNVTAGIGILEQASPMIQDFFRDGRRRLQRHRRRRRRLRRPAVAVQHGRPLRVVQHVGLHRPQADLHGLPRRRHRRSTSLLALVGSTSTAIFVLIAAIIISFYGGGFATIPAYLRDLFGVFQVGAIHGRLLTAWSAAGVAGPLIINGFLDSRRRRRHLTADSYRPALFTMVGDPRGRLRGQPAGPAGGREVPRGHVRAQGRGRGRARGQPGRGGPDRVRRHQHRPAGPVVGRGEHPARVRRLPDGHDRAQALLLSLRPAGLGGGPAVVTYGRAP